MDETIIAGWSDGNWGSEDWQVDVDMAAEVLADEVVDEEVEL